VQARFTAIKDKRVNIRLSFADLLALQAKTLSEGMPWQSHTWQIQNLLFNQRAKAAPPA
jgi:predicted DNA binding CopG/RHH family protein